MPVPHSAGFEAKNSFYFHSFERKLSEGVLFPLAGWGVSS
jgi:hypothetical protein